MPDVDVDEIVAELRERIAVRRAAGEYPIGLEQQLESEFQWMMRAIDRHEIDTDRLGTMVDAVAAAANGMPVAAETTSRLPGGSAAHHVAGNVVRRHVNPLADSVRSLGESVADALEEIRRLFVAQSAADERQLHDVIAGVMDRLAVIDHLVELTTDLERRVAELESGRRET